jgi:hypothetical protein
VEDGIGVGFVEGAEEGEAGSVTGVGQPVGVKATRTAIVGDPGVVPVGTQEREKTQAGEAVVGAHETRFGPGLKPVGQEPVAEVDVVEVEGQAKEAEAGLGGGDAKEEFHGSWRAG